MQLVPNDSGCYLKLIIQLHSSDPLEENVKMEILGNLKEFYIAVVTEIRNAPSE